MLAVTEGQARKHNLSTFAFLDAKLKTVLADEGLSRYSRKQVLACLKVLAFRLREGVEEGAK